jgi:hypothetical protein
VPATDVLDAPATPDLLLLRDLHLQLRRPVLVVRVLGPMLRFCDYFRRGKNEENGDLCIMKMVTFLLYMNC